MNVALLVRRQSYWSAQIGAHESRHADARLSEKGCGIRRNVYGCERVTGLRINLARGLARAIAANALKGRRLLMHPAKWPASAGMSLPFRRRHSPRCDID